MWIAAERVKSGQIEYLIKWKGYDHTYDTWQTRGDILDKKLIANWRTKSDAMHFELWSMRAEVGKKVKKMRAEEGDVEIPIPAVHSTGARALLRYLARPPSREGSTALKLEEQHVGGRVRFSLELNGLEDIGWALLLQTIYPGEAYGALIYCKGTSSAW